MKQLIYRLTEPARTIPDERKIFSNHDLKILIVPLFLEQLLEVLVGVADTFMVSYAGEAAVSGVSLVNMFNTVFIYLFSALAAGGAVVVSQYIGSRDSVLGSGPGHDPCDYTQYFQRPVLSSFRSTCKRTPGCRRCEVHHVCQYILNDRLPCLVFYSLWNMDEPGCDRHRFRHVRGLDDPGGILLDPLPEREVEGVPGDRMRLSVT